MVIIRLIPVLLCFSLAKIQKNQGIKKKKDEKLQFVLLFAQLLVILQAEMTKQRQNG